MTGGAFGQGLEGADLPDSAIIARSGGPGSRGETKPGELPDIVAIYNANQWTQGDIRLVIPYFEWVLQTPLAVAEKNEMRRRLIAEWTRPDSDLAKTLTQNSIWGFIHNAALINRAELSDPLISNDVRRLNDQARIVARLRARSGEKDAQWVLARYNAARRPLSAATPALTQPVADMFAASTAFALNEVAGRKIATDSPAFRAAMTRRLALQWPKMQIAQRRQIIALPASWASFKQFYWPNASEAGREEKRVVWGKQLSPAFPSIRGVVARRAKSWAQIQAKQRAAWARLSPVQRDQLISAFIAQNMAASRATFAAMSESALVSHAANMNIINNSRSSPGTIDYYSVR